VKTIFRTADGSDTVFDSGLHCHYHSINGAFTESQHVFILNGFDRCAPGRQAVRIFEVGLGTGLNALLTACRAAEHPNLMVSYHAIEAEPLALHLAGQLNYPDFLGTEETKNLFYKIHQVPWDQCIALLPNFCFRKIQADFLSWCPDAAYDLIYHDAFAPGDQPELWTHDAIQTMRNALDCGGILSSYCAKGSFRRTLRACGFEVMRLPGPPGKREMTLATAI